MTVNQKGATAGGDVVAGDKFTTNNYLPVAGKQTKIEKLKARLQQEIADGKHSPQLIAQLQTFSKTVPDDGVSGLEAKLEMSGRSDQLIVALEMKERFAKLLDQWSLYASAQEIFVHLLLAADYRYAHQIAPLIENCSRMEIDEITEQKIIVPLIDDVGIDVFSLDHHTAMGMIYWLAEQCRVRWHP